MKIFFDTTILVELDRKMSKSESLARSLVENCHEILISTVTISEVLAGSYLTKNVGNSVMEAKRIMSQFTFIDLDEKIAETSAKYIAFLTVEGNIIEFPDIVIAATAIETNSDYLITLNKQHFQRLPELKGKVFTPSEFIKKIRL